MEPLAFRVNLGSRKPTQNGQLYTLEEAKEIGDGLVDFYSVLTELYNHKQDPKDE